ncbi:MAG: 50S ribosomal protein L9 [Bacilli bacterium]
MKVILLQDVKGVGKKSQIVEVSDGYALNFLLPRRLAVKETTKSVEILEKQKLDAKILDETNRKNAEELKEKLTSITLEFKAKSGKDGKMFGSISLKQIEQELLDKHHITIDKRKFIDKGPVSSFGYTRLKIELYKGVVGVINVHIDTEGK